MLPFAPWPVEIIEITVGFKNGDPVKDLCEGRWCDLDCQRRHIVFCHESARSEIERKLEQAQAEEFVSKGAQRYEARVTLLNLLGDYVVAQMKQDLQVRLVRALKEAIVIRKSQHETP